MVVRLEFEVVVNVVNGWWERDEKEEGGVDNDEDEERPDGARMGMGMDVEDEGRSRELEFDVFD